MAAFPLAFAIIIPAVYFPIIVMLLALVFRGVAFEFRFKQRALQALWGMAFCFGSAVATFAQGVVLGAFIQGFKVDGRHFAGGSFDFLTPFAILTGIALMFGYGLLGAGWLIMKTEGDLQAWSRRAGRICLVGVAHRRPCGERLDAARRSGDRAALVQLAQHPVPVAGAGGDRGARGARLVCVRQPLRAAAVPFRDRAVPDVVHRHHHQPVADDRAASLYAVGGVIRRRARRRFS